MGFEWNGNMEWNGEVRELRAKLQVAVRCPKSNAGATRTFTRYCSEYNFYVM